MKKISVSIPCYNSSEFILNVLRYPVTDERIDEIIISDDGSADFEKLKEKIATLNSSKIKLIRNEINSGGCYKNKAIAASHAKNEWIILFDSDNVFGKEYVDALYAIDQWDPKVFYCAESGQSLPHFSWPDFTEKPIDLNTFKRYIKNKSIKVNFFKKNFYKLFFIIPNPIRKLISSKFLMRPSSRFLALMNDCNYFVHKESYLHIHEISLKQNINPFAADTIFTNYTWFKNNNYLKVVKKMEYYHTIHSDSYWVKTVSNYEQVVEWIVNDLYSDKHVK